MYAGTYQTANSIPYESINTYKLREIISQRWAWVL